LPVTGLDSPHKRGRPSSVSACADHNIRYLSQFCSYRDLAKIFGVSHNVIYHRLKRRWASATEQTTSAEPCSDKERFIHLLEDIELIQRLGYLPYELSISELVARAQTFLHEHVLDDDRLARAILYLLSRFHKQRTRKMSFDPAQYPFVSSLEIVSATYVTNFKRDLELVAVFLSLKGLADYSPTLFPGLIFRTRTKYGNGTLVAFNSGKVIILGVTGFKAAKAIVQEFARQVGWKDLISFSRDENVRFAKDIPSRPYSPTYSWNEMRISISNIMVLARLTKGISLEDLVEYFSKNRGAVAALDYSPDISPTLLCRFGQEHFPDEALHWRTVSLLVSAAGTIIIYAPSEVLAVKSCQRFLDLLLTADSKTDHAILFSRMPDKPQRVHVQVIHSRLPEYDMAWPLHISEGEGIFDVGKIDFSNSAYVRRDFETIKRESAKRDSETGPLSYQDFLESASKFVERMDPRGKLPPHHLKDIAEAIDRYISRHLFDREIDYSKSENCQALFDPDVFLFVVDKVFPRIRYTFDRRNYKLVGIWKKLSDVGQLAINPNLAVDTSKCIYPKLEMPSTSDGMGIVHMFERSRSVLAYSKLDKRHQFVIPFLDERSYWQVTVTDFIVKTRDRMHLVEIVDELPHALWSNHFGCKVRGIIKWCEMASGLTPPSCIHQPEKWEYLIAPKSWFQARKHASFQSCVIASRRLWDGMTTE